MYHVVIAHHSAENGRYESGPSKSNQQMFGVRGLHKQAGRSGRRKEKAVSEHFQRRFTMVLKVVHSSILPQDELPLVPARTRKVVRTLKENAGLQLIVF